MTDSQQSQQSEHLTVMEEMLHPRLVRAIDGRIIELADERIEAAIGRLRSEVSELAATQATIREQAQRLPEEQRREVQPEVDAASRETQDAVRTTNDLQARRQAGEQIDEQEVDQARRQSDQAASAQQQASDRVRSVSTTDRQPAQDDPRHGAIRRVVQEQESQPRQRQERPVIDRNSYVTHAQLDQRLDQVGARIRTAETNSSRALAIAQASVSSDNAFRRAATWWLITFVVVGVLYWLLFGVGPFDWTFRDQFAWPFGLATMVGCIGAITAHDSQSRAEAQAHSGGHDDHHDEYHEDRPDNGRSSRASAHASA